MFELTELERLEKDVVDTEATYVWHNDAADLWNAAVADDDGIESDAAYVADLAADKAAITHDAWVKAKLELSDYLKEQDNE